VRPFRGWEYYFTTPGLLSSTSSSAGTGTKASPDADAGSGFIEKRRQFEDVAVSGDEVVRLQQQAWVSFSSPSVYLGCSVDIWSIARLPSPLASNPPKTGGHEARPRGCGCCVCYGSACSGRQRAQVAPEAGKEASGAAAQASGCRGAGEGDRGREAESEEPREEDQAEAEGEGDEGCWPGRRSCRGRRVFRGR
jgi:hypothetical protein